MTRRPLEPCPGAVFYSQTEGKKNDLYFLVPFGIFERKFPYRLGFFPLARLLNSKQIKSWDRDTGISNNAPVGGLAEGRWFPSQEITPLCHGSLEG